MSQRIPVAIIVSGPPASGKSTIATQIAERSALPYVNKDGFKEVLFDTVGGHDPAWSSKLNRASYAILYHVAEALLRAGRSLIIEANFRPEAATAHLDVLRQAHPFTPLQIHCTAEVETLLHRFRARWASGKRHPGHADDRHLAAIEAAIRRNAYGALPLDGPSIIVDTTRPGDVDLEALLSQVGSLLVDQ